MGWRIGDAWSPPNGWRIAAGSSSRPSTNRRATREPRRGVVMTAPREPGWPQGRRQLRRGFELSRDATSLKADWLAAFDMNASS
jgi:hypothetical protein